MTWSLARRRAGAVVVLAAVAVGGCGGADRPRASPADRVRRTVRAYLGALQARDWPRACALMTEAARRDLEDAAGAQCARALAAGAAGAAQELASAQREVAGADVRISGAVASVGPIGTAQQLLRLRRVGGRWLVAR